MVEKNSYTFDCTIFDREDKNPYLNIIGILLNCQIKTDLLHWILKRLDIIICADGGANILFDLNKGQYIPDWIVGDFESIRPDVKDYYVSKGSKLAHRSNIDTTDIEKAIYISLEQISEKQFSHKSAIFIIGSGGRVDHTYSTFSSVYKYNNDYKELNTDVFMVSCSSISFYLKPGINCIITSKKMEFRDEGYSLICFSKSGTIKLEEIPEKGYENTAIKLEKEFKFGESVFFRKKHHANEILLKIQETKNGDSMPFMYSFTTLHHTQNERV